MHSPSKGYGALKSEKGMVSDAGGNSRGQVVDSLHDSCSTSRLWQAAECRRCPNGTPATVGVPLCPAPYCITPCPATCQQ